jgi:substrate import-associated zinc metallohydrolase lipoprotein
MMKKSIYISCLLCVLFLSGACRQDNLSSTSIFTDDTAVAENAFDVWLNTNFVKPYNIEFQYHLKTIETDNAYTLVPADYNKSVQLAHIVLYAWLQTYDEVAGAAFTRKYVPKQLQLVGSAAYNLNGTTAQDASDRGVKVTLYAVNDLKLDSSSLLANYMKAMHHEFVHALMQQLAYDKNFDKISAAAYVSNDWYKKTSAEALKAGFITPYAMSEAGEDFAETASVYLVSNAATWNGYITAAGTSGAETINAKLETVRSYMQANWSIDIDKLRDVTLRRIADVVNGKVNLTTLK